MMRSNITLAQSYELFGLKSVGSIDEVKQIYRQIAKQLHPDLNPQDPTARDRFNYLNQAYQLLLVAAETANSHAHYHPWEDMVDKIDFEKLARLTTGSSKVIRDLVGLEG